MFLLILLLDLDFGLRGTDYNLPGYLFQIWTASLHAHISYLHTESPLQPAAKYNMLFFLCVLCQA